MVLDVKKSLKEFQEILKVFQRFSNDFENFILKNEKTKQIIT
jgi:hypothetical protein